MDHSIFHRLRFRMNKKLGLLGQQMLNHLQRLCAEPKKRLGPLSQQWESHLLRLCTDLKKRLGPRAQQMAASLLRLCADLKKKLGPPGQRMVASLQRLCAEQKKKLGPRGQRMVGHLHRLCAGVQHKLGPLGQRMAGAFQRVRSGLSKQQITLGKQVLGGCLVLGLPLLLMINLVRCAFTPHWLPAETVTVQQAAPPELIEKSFAGVHLSETGKTKYELNSGEKRFAYFTTIGGRLLLQTEISPYEASKIDAAGAVIEISGGDRQAGGAPPTRLRITRLPDQSFKVERMKPVGGSLGVFHKQP